jgi:hypothetical protein
MGTKERVAAQALGVQRAVNGDQGAQEQLVQLVGVGGDLVGYALPNSALFQLALYRENRRFGDRGLIRARDGPRGFVATCGSFGGCVCFFHPRFSAPAVALQSGSPTVVGSFAASAAAFRR